MCSSEFSEAFDDAEGFGWSKVKPSVDIKKFLARKVGGVVPGV